MNWTKLTFCTIQNVIEIYECRTARRLCTTWGQEPKREAIRNKPAKFQNQKLSLTERLFLCASDGQFLYVTGEHQSVKGIHQNFSEECRALPSLCQENKLTAPRRILRQNQLRARFQCFAWSLWLDMWKINLRANLRAIWALYMIYDYSVFENRG